MGSAAGSIPESFAKLSFLRVVLLGQNRLTGARASCGLCMRACDIMEATPWQVLLGPQLVPERACCGHRHCAVWAKRLLHAAQPEQELHRRCCCTLPAAGALLSSTASGCDTAACAVGAGTLPDMLRNSTLMQYMDLSRNYFRGVLLPFVAHALMYSLLTAVPNSMLCCHLTGTLPSSWGAMVRLNHLDLSNNWLTGVGIVPWRP